MFPTRLLLWPSEIALNRIRFFFDAFHFLVKLLRFFQHKIYTADWIVSSLHQTTWIESNQRNVRHFIRNLANNPKEHFVQRNIDSNFMSSFSITRPNNIYYCEWDCHSSVVRFISDQEAYHFYRHFFPFLCIFPSIWQFFILPSGSFDIVSFKLNSFFPATIWYIFFFTNEYAMNKNNELNKHILYNEYII